MTETPTAADLEIPAAAAAMMLSIDDDWDNDGALNNAVRAIAAPVVAAAYRQQADQFETLIQPDSVLPEPRTLRMVVDRLRARADELDPKEA